MRQLTSENVLYLRVSEATARFGVGRTKLYELLGAGALGGTKKLGRTTLISVASLQAYFETLPEYFDELRRAH